MQEGGKDLKKKRTIYRYAHDSTMTSNDLNNELVIRANFDL